MSTNDGLASTSLTQKYPKILNLSKGTQTCLSFANSFACGVFLAMCLISLIPSSNSTWKQILTHKTNEDSNEMMKDLTTIFPWSEFLTLIGFTVIFGIDVLQGTTREHPTSSDITSSGKNPPGKLFQALAFNLK